MPQSILIVRSLTSDETDQRPFQIFELREVLRLSCQELSNDRGRMPQHRCDLHRVVEDVFTTLAASDAFVFTDLYLPLRQFQLKLVQRVRELRLKNSG